MGVFIFIVFLIVTFVIPFYLTISQPIVGLALSVIIFWTTLFLLLSFQYYFTVYTRLGSNVIKSFKKCLLISLDNTGFSFFMMIHNLLPLLLSALIAFKFPGIIGIMVLIVFIFPGPVGILLYLDEALRLRLLKYDWLEENPEANRRKIPWDALLIEEREKTGTRTFRNFIFPWKD